MAEKDSASLKETIRNDIPDNNTGAISAQDIRNNMVDVVDSILGIVTKELDSSKPFEKTIKIGSSNDNAYLHVHSGIQFGDNATLQTEPYPGAGAISHSGLADLDEDDHLHYFIRTGARPIEGNVQINNHWISSSGTTNRGIKFSQDSSQNETIDVASNTSFKFGDNSVMSTFAGSPRAWINFTAASGTPPTGIAVRSSFNVSAIERINHSSGKFRIYFNEGTLNDTNFVAVATSNSRSDNDNAEDYDLNEVGLVSRSGDGTAVSPHSITFLVKNASSQYVDAAQNDLVIFGLPSGVTQSSFPQVTQ